MSLSDNKIMSLGKVLLNIAKEEYGQDLITLRKLYTLCQSVEMAQTILSSTNLMSDKVKTIYSAFFIQSNKTKEEITKLINDLYFVTIDFYDETDYIENECSSCYGDGYQDCSNCEGTGKEDCRTCDGDGEIDCDSCGGDGTEDCRHCDGRGTETEEDDEGDEIEVECVVCDGSGEEKCRDCSGSGNFECPNCEGSGNEECSSCAGGGNEMCDECDGTGETKSEEEFYNITKRQYVTVGNLIEKYDGEIMLYEIFEEKDSNFEMLVDELNLFSSSYYDDIPADERNNSADVDDYFVEIVDVLKLERVNKRLAF